MASGTSLPVMATVNSSEWCFYQNFFFLINQIFAKHLNEILSQRYKNLSLPSLRLLPTIRKLSKLHSKK